MTRTQEDRSRLATEIAQRKASDPKKEELFLTLSDMFIDEDLQRDFEAAGKSVSDTEIEAVRALADKIKLSALLDREGYHTETVSSNARLWLSRILADTYPKGTEKNAPGISGRHAAKERVDQFCENVEKVITEYLGSQKGRR